MSSSKAIPKKQTALILGGGGALGAYEAGAIKAICNNLLEQEKKDQDHNGLLFDIIAGTSIGAMNGAVFVSQFLQTGTWNDAANSLINFWTDPDKGLGSNINSDQLTQLQRCSKDQMV